MNIFNAISKMLLLVLVMLSTFGNSMATGFPYLWDKEERSAAEEARTVSRLRFLMPTDFPPFSFLDSHGRLTGYHVDFAQQLCQQLNILERCEVQALPTSEILTALNNGQGEAALGTAIEAGGNNDIAATRSYFPLPARFVARIDAPFQVSDHQPGGSQSRVGVMAGSRHEMMLRTYFPALKPVIYTREQWMLDDLKNGSVKAVFSDAMRLSFWIGGKASEKCCAFSSDVYYAPNLLGEGLRILVSVQNADLVPELERGIKALSDKGIMQELYLRYFPIGFY